MKKITIILLVAISVLFSNCGAKVFHAPAQMVNIEGVKVERPENSTKFYLHFPSDISKAEFNKSIDGLTMFYQVNKYLIMVEVSPAFDQYKIIETLIKSRK